MLMTKDLRAIIETQPIYKMSLGQAAVYEAESLERGVLILGADVPFYDAVISGDGAAIARTGTRIKSESYPNAGAPENAWRIWAGNIYTFRELATDTVVIHWSSAKGQLYWGIVGDGPMIELRQETDNRGQRAYIFIRALREGWRKTSVNDLIISGLHPKARALAINQATISRVQTDTDMFRALLLDEPIDAWAARPDWKAALGTSGWRPKDLSTLITARRAARITSEVTDVADDFEDHIKRMAQTALHTVEYANGQAVIRIVKPKETDLNRDELEEEIARLFKVQAHRCALTHYDFKKKPTNKHLQPSLDRIDSDHGYVLGNMQIVTRAANFFKSASDAADWADKSLAMEQMAIALQRKRKENLSTS
jgi:hypothetical protein